MAVAQGLVSFLLVVDGVTLQIEVLVMVCDLGRIDLLLDQPEIGQEGVAKGR